MIRLPSPRLLAYAAAVVMVAHSPEGQSAPAPAPAATATAPVVQMDHISIETVGKGSPVFLIPGLSMSRENWRETANLLAPTHRVYLVQLNGFGGSAAGGNVNPGLLDGVVGDLHAFVGRERIKGAAVVGHSLGGLLGLMFAKAHPEDVGRLLVVDSLPFAALLMAPATVTVAQVEPQAKMMRDTVAALQDKPVDVEKARAQIAMLALKPESREKALGWSIQADRRVTAEAFYEDLTTDLRGDLPKLAMPITLIYPSAQTRPAKEAGDALYHGAYAGTPNLTFVTIADSGHFVMLDQPAAFQAALMAFLGK